jgi:hypothetical protein
LGFFGLARQDGAALESVTMSEQERNRIRTSDPPDCQGSLPNLKPEQTTLLALSIGTLGFGSWVILVLMPVLTDSITSQANLGTCRADLVLVLAGSPLS